MDAVRVWSSADRLIDGAPSIAALREHRLEPLAVRRFRATGRPVPDTLGAAARLAGIRHLAAPVVLRQVRALCDGPLVLLKGPEVAARYPGPSARGYGDVDLLVRDAEEVQACLVMGGFFEVGDPATYEGIHHLRPLQWPGLPLIVELHMRPKWPDGLSAPSVDELFASARPNAVGVRGIDALPPAQHALAIAAHAWAHEPLHRVRDLLDVAALAAECEPGEIGVLAERWGVSRLWRTTARAIDAVLDEGRLSLAMRCWARSTSAVRGRTVAEWHLEKWMSSWSVLPPTCAVRRSWQAVAADLRPDGGEGWSPKLRRVPRAARNAFMPRTEHTEEAS